MKGDRHVTHKGVHFPPGMVEALSVMGSMTIYVRIRDVGYWHWCRNCTRYPSNRQVELQSTMPVGDLCNECLMKERADDCKS